MNKKNKRFSLLLSEIQKKFCIYIHPTDNPIERVHNEFSQRIFDLTEHIIEPLISECDSLTSSIEQSMLSKEELRDLFEMYKKLQSLKWENYLVQITNDENSRIEWMNKTWQVWNKEIEQKLRNICIKLAKKWMRTSFSNSNSAYHI